MNPLNDLFSGPENLVWFVGGILSVQVWQWIKCKSLDLLRPEEAPHTMKKLNWFYAWTAVVLVAVGVVSVQTLRTYDFANELAQDTQACQIEFNKALAARSRISNENDQISVFQRETLYRWIHDLIFPPPPYASMDPNDPQRQAWALSRTVETDRALEGSIRQQKANDEERARNPYPDPTCGRVTDGN